MNSPNQPLSDCHQAPVVICEGAAWDIPVESVRAGFTYHNGCPECHRTCGLYVADQPEPKTQQETIDFITAPKTIAKVVEGSIDKRLKILESQPDAPAEVELRKKLIVELTIYKAAVCNAYMHFNGQEEGEDPVMDKYWQQEKDAEITLLTAIQADRDTAMQKAEELMGEAVIARHRQANYQWEKTESFIQSYQEQKRSNPHGLTCLQPPTAGEGERV